MCGAWAAHDDTFMPGAGAVRQTGRMGLRLLAGIFAVLAVFLWLQLGLGVLIATGNWFVSPADLGGGPFVGPLVFLAALALGVTLFAFWLRRKSRP